MMWGMNNWRDKALAGAVVVIGMTTGVTPVLAQPAGVPDCIGIDEDAARLACYDALFRNGDAAPAEAGAPQVVAIQSERPIPARPSGREPATLTFSCEAGNIQVAFRFAGQLVSNTGDIAPLTYQIDAGGTTVRTLRANADNTELTFSSAADTQNFLDSLAGGSSVRVRVTPVRQRSVNVVFRSDEVAEDLAALLAACN